MENLRDIRLDYNKSKLEEALMPDEPFRLFKNWLEAALQSDEQEPTAMVLSTVSPEGRPSSRIVLLKDFHDGALVFYSNYQSRKGEELKENPNAALLFFWPALERQVRLEGKVQQITAEESDRYFYSRPLESRIGAAISPQSQIIPDRKTLEEAFHKELENMQNGLEPKRPVHWGGYKLIPEIMEFWQGRPGRMHDRFQYRLADGQWLKNRLAP